MAVSTSDCCLHEVFLAQALRTPDAVAIQLGSLATVTYAELRARSQVVARSLAVRGVGRHQFVCVLVERSVALVTGLFGISLAGAAFVHIDPSYPPPRIALILDEVSSSAVLTIRDHAAAVPCDVGSSVIWLDNLEAPAVAHAATAGGPARPDDVAYAIFTSGSTGRPKGVLIEHRSAVHVGVTFVGRWRVGPEDRVFQFFAPSFDPSILDYMLALFSGARLILWSGVWHRALRESGATMTGLTPSAMAALTPSQLAGVRLVMVGGEALPLPIGREWARHYTLLNCYGPTECTIWATTQARKRFSHTACSFPQLTPPQLPHKRPSPGRLAVRCRHRYRNAAQRLYVPRCGQLRARAACGCSRGAPYRWDRARARLPAQAGPDVEPVCPKPIRPRPRVPHRRSRVLDRAGHAPLAREDGLAGEARRLPR